MKKLNIIYALLMVLFAVLAFIFFDRGFNVRTKRYVNYQVKSNISYKVYLFENDIYPSEYLTMGKRYMSNLVDDIVFDISYDNLFSDNISGYYSYKVVATLLVYDSAGEDNIFNEDYTVYDNTVSVLNQNDLKKINIRDTVTISYDAYRDKLKKIIDNYNDSVSGFLEVKFIIDENIEFSEIDKIVSDEKILKATIPLTYDTFRITLSDDYNEIDDYYDFSTFEDVNYLLLIFGSLCLSISISFLALIIRAMVIIYNNQSKYSRELSKIFSEYDDIIVRVNRFYNKKKYNLIYVSSFDELIDVYNKVGNPISYREIRKGYESVFLIIDDDNAWIYRMK